MRSHRVAKPAHPKNGIVYRVDDWWYWTCRMCTAGRNGGYGMERTAKWALSKHRCGGVP